MILRPLLLLAAISATACGPKIRFRLAQPPPPRLSLIVTEISDSRPTNERVGYKIFYGSSINDTDYADGFEATFRHGLLEALASPFELRKPGAEADLRLEVEVLHFYGEYAQSVKSVFLEYAAWLLLGLPRLVSDAIPYNQFAGRAMIRLRFVDRGGRAIDRLVDVRVVDEVSTYNRSPRATTEMLCEAAEVVLSKSVRAVHHQFVATRAIQGTK